MPMSMFVQAQGVRSYPTFIIFQDAKPVYRQSGFSKESLLAALQKHGADLSVCFVIRIGIALIIWRLAFGIEHLAFGIEHLALV